MSWTTALARWPNLLDQLCRDFSYLELTALERFRGDRTKLEVYLAETHDLTTSEARQTLTDWLAYRAATATRELAA